MRECFVNCKAPHQWEVSDASRGPGPSESTLYPQPRRSDCVVSDAQTPRAG